MYRSLYSRGGRWYYRAAVLLWLLQSCARSSEISVRVVALSAIVGLLAVTWAILRRRPNPHRRAQQEAATPLEAWARAAFFVVTGDVDYGHLPRAEARRMLIHWWEIHGPYELQHGLRDLEEPGRPDNAWDLLRFLLVARLGAAAQYVTEEESWTRIEPVARRLQATYDGWAAMAQSYVAARRQWKGIAIDGSEDDDGMRRILDNIARLRDDVWTSIDWGTPLSEPEPDDE